MLLRFVYFSFLAWGFERSIASAKEKLKFGKGSIKGLAAPETANNAACTGSFVPLLTLGIPGSGTTAVMFGLELFPVQFLQTSVYYRYRTAPDLDIYNSENEDQLFFELQFFY